MQEQRLPRVIRNIKPRGSMLVLSNKRRILRNSQHLSLQISNHSASLFQMAKLNPLVAKSIQNLNMQRMRGVSEHIDKMKASSIPFSLKENKKVFILNQKHIDQNENIIVDLKTCKSLLNPKIKASKKPLFFIDARRRFTHHYYMNSNNLLEFTQEQRLVKERPKQIEQQSTIQPWSYDHNQKQNLHRYHLKS